MIPCAMCTGSTAGWRVPDAEHFFNLAGKPWYVALCIVHTEHYAVCRGVREISREEFIVAAIHEEQILKNRFEFQRAFGAWSEWYLRRTDT